VHPHAITSWELAIILTANLGLALFEWVNVRKYTDGLLAAAGQTTFVPAHAAGTAGGVGGASAGGTAVGGTAAGGAGATGGPGASAADVNPAPTSSGY
jgi:hypothetical protein